MNLPEYANPIKVAKAISIACKAIFIQENIMNSNVVFINGLL